MAGRSHWSASVELDPHSGSLTFDMACRVRAAERGWLGSSYIAIYSQRAVDDRHVIFADDETPNVGIDLAICDDSEACLAADAEGVTISPAEMWATGHHSMCVWAYRISRREAWRNANLERQLVSGLLVAQRGESSEYPFDQRRHGSCCLGRATPDLCRIDIVESRDFDAHVLFAKPVDNHLGRDLQMKLQAVRSGTIAKGLMLAGRLARCTAPAGRSNVSPCH